VSAVPGEESSEVGGLQNTATQFGASLGTALAGSVLIAALTASFLSGVSNNPAVPPDLAKQANVTLASGVPFISDADLEKGLEQAGVDQKATNAIVDENQRARVDGLRRALALLALLSMVALFFTRGIPARQPGSAEPGT
jgi:hypothetical protein